MDEDGPAGVPAPRGPDHRERGSTVDEMKSSVIWRDVHPEVLAGDPFAYAAARREFPACFGGYVTITVEEDGIERDEAVPCRRCSADR